MNNNIRENYLRKWSLLLKDVNQEKQYTLVTKKNLTVDKFGDPREFKLFRQFAGLNWYPYIKVKNIIPDGNNNQLVELHFQYKDKYDVHAETSRDYGENWWLIHNVDYELGE